MMSNDQGRGEDRSLREPHAPTVPQQVYLWLSGLFVTAIVMANVVGVKLFTFETGVRLPWQGEGESLKVEHTAGMIAFPVTFLLTDLLNEYFGARAARRVAFVGFGMAGVAFGLIEGSRALPTLEGIPGTATASSFENVFGSATLMYIASMAAFLLGSLLDIGIFTTFNRLTRGKLVWLRTTGSTVVSQVFDSLIVTSLFFWVFPVVRGAEHEGWDFVLRTAATGYVLKFVLAVVLTPVIYAGRWGMSRVFGLRPAAVFGREAAVG